MAQGTIPCRCLRIGMYLIGQDRLWLQTPFRHQRFTIKDPSEIEVRCLSPKGRKTIRDVRHAVREDLDVESVLRQVSA